MWFKGSLHIHTTNSDGELNPLEVCEWYKNKGFDFIAITDHDVITKIDRKPSKDFLVLENSIEFTYPDMDLHIQGIGLKNNKLDKQQDYQKIIDFIIESDGIAIINHPNWEWKAKFSRMSNLKNYHGIEIFNAFIKQEPRGSPFALEKWDYLLSQGQKVWGFAVDDLHKLKEHLIFKGWIVVNAKKLIKKDILDSIKKGNFYSSTGVILKNFCVNGNKFYVSSQNGEELVFVADNGEIIEVMDGKDGEIEIDGKYKYIRCEIRSSEGIAYTQPVFIDSMDL